MLTAGEITTVVRLALSASTVGGYPCILYPVTEILEDVFFGPRFEFFEKENLLLPPFVETSEGLSTSRCYRPLFVADCRS